LNVWFFQTLAALDPVACFFIELMNNFEDIDSI